LTLGLFHLERDHSEVPKLLRLQFHLDMAYQGAYKISLRRMSPQLLEQSIFQNSSHKYYHISMDGERD